MTSIYIYIYKTSEDENESAYVLLGLCVFIHLSYIYIVKNAIMPYPMRTNVNQFLNKSN